MKKLMLILSLVFLVSCSSGSDEQEYVFKYNDTVIRMGDSEDGLDSIKDQYTYTEESAGCGSTEICGIYSYGNFTVRTQNKKIQKITLNTDLITTPEGVCIGQSREKIIDAYGEGYTSKGESIIYINGETSLNFVLRDGKITSIYYEVKGK